MFTVVLYSACHTPNIAVSNDLKTNSSVLDAKGRGGFQFNQVIKFGDYATSKVKRGWTKGSTININFVARFQKAEQKLSFTQNTPDNKSAEVLAISEFKNNEIDLMKDFLSYSFEYQNTFAGVIIPSENPDNTWDFIVHNPNASLPNNADCGIIKGKSGNNILIKGIKKIEGSKWTNSDNLGFEFIQDGKSIGAVSTMNYGKVWIKNDISADLKLVVSSVATSLLVRHNISSQSKSAINLNIRK